MSYHTPGFRQTHNWFPKEIYFTATTKEVRAYHEKNHDFRTLSADTDMTEEWMRNLQLDDDYINGPELKPGLNTEENAERNGSRINTDMDSGNNHSKPVVGDLKFPEPENAMDDASSGSVSAQNTADARVTQDLSVQVGDLQVQVKNLQRHITAQLEQHAIQQEKQAMQHQQHISQQEQAQRQLQDQLQQRKDLLLQRLAA
ncbi:hypothetical protein BC939DRAFT_447481 [Gamsiella multidivaricata]|uniref:uncharacterized protein n=1 Tax=Gamsiella multidivaricata TaxID=101098 RepID=UPI00221F7E51|nr:uncharacterized protein BC939DRAFT_447481 [Gamsiella multidivaricata]KAI7826000.1 hypothetical protein BC939DRAFT_447481 [Gamsiella multidivaricata]